MNGSDNGTAVPTRKRVLVIEDNRDFARLFGDMLDIMGFDAEVVFDARSGLDGARRSRPTLIFCDLGLPGELDGFDFARELRADNKLAGIPLVGVSGRTAPEDVSEALAAGFDQLLPKPVKFADVSRVLTKYSTA